MSGQPEKRLRRASGAGRDGDAPSSSGSQPRREEPRLLPMLLLFVSEDQGRRIAASLDGGSAVVTDVEAAIRMLRQLSGEPRPSCPRWIPVRDEDRVLLVPTEEIDWVESRRNEVILHWKQRRLRLRRGMGEMESLLDPARFIRIHRNAIVRADFILELTPWFKGRHVVSLRDGTKLTSARSRWNPFRQWIGEIIQAVPRPGIAGRV